MHIVPAVYDRPHDFFAVSPYHSPWMPHIEDVFFDVFSIARIFAVLKQERTGLEHLGILVEASVGIYVSCLPAVYEDRFPFVVPAERGPLRPELRVVGVSLPSKHAYRFCPGKITSVDPSDDAVVFDGYGG